MWHRIAATRVRMVPRSMRLRWLPVAAAALLCTAPSPPAAAQDALALFQQGRALVGQKRWAEACPLFAEAHRIDRGAVGIVLNLADCQKEVGKLASAWSAYKEAEFLCRKANDPERERYAHEHVVALEPKLAKLKITGLPTPGVTVTRDDQEVGKGALGVELPVDTGEHTVRVTAPGYKPWTTTVKIPTDGLSIAIDVPALEQDESAHAAAGGPGGGAPFAWTAQRGAGLGAMILGVAGLGVGGALGGVAMSRYNASKEGCVPGHPDVCPAAQVSDRNGVAKLADASTGALIAGGVVAAAGVVVFLTGGPRAKSKMGALPRVEAAPLAGVGTAGMTLRGAW